ncbi:hypothetical protein BN946_scf184636.g1 [Trametes cinnabarina]|uniref:Uncharacterized protein n=1 Tax=Pycnoporus cinnabarinus TaxID=5643 RepID=A0A060SE62_PYCCI|nr:hypothetical protein BN946_scf184636.g1 [Trametes cinnabarina]
MSFQNRATNSPILPAALAGFVGGEATASALTYSHVYGRRNVLSLYNTPGSYEVAQLLKTLVRSRFWDGQRHDEAGVSVNPDAFVQTTPASGPKYTAAFSGTTMETTGDVAQILKKYCGRLPMDAIAVGRVTTPYAVTIAELDHAPAGEEHPTLKTPAPFLPILASVGASAACAALGDWHIFSMIVLGMFCNGATSSVLRSGDLTFTRPATTPGAPPGDGFLENDNEIIILKGSEAAVSAVTRGRLSLRFPDEKSLKRLATCGTLSTIQSLVQLFVVPQGTFVGQLLFLFSLSVAWLYNSVLSTSEKEAKEEVVMENLLNKPTMRRYSLGTRASMAVFLMQVLKPTNVEEQLAGLVPNKTRVWSLWRQTVARRLRDEKPVFEMTLPAEATGFSIEETTLLRTLLSDAQVAVDVYNTAGVRL